MIVAKEFRFESAHRLSKYVGKCQRIHGHNYRGIVYVKSAVDDRGMVIDFSDLKKVINKHIVEKFDHMLILQHDDEKNKEVHQTELGAESIIFVPYNPTAENMAQSFLAQLRVYIPDVCRVDLYETDDSFAIAEV